MAIPGQTDDLFPTLALHHLGAFAAVVFVVGLTAATFSSADSVLTTLTTSFCMDLLGMEERKDMTDAQRTALRHKVHVGFAVVLWLVILGFQALNSKAIIDAIFTLASYTYGPLLGLFAFGLFARRARAGPLGAAGLLRRRRRSALCCNRTPPRGFTATRWALNCSS